VKKILLTLVGLLMMSLIYGQEKAEKLKKILNRIEEIKTASYYTKSSSSAPNDTLAFHSYERFVNMYVDTTDKFLGAKYSTSETDNHLKLDFCYDGDYVVRFDWRDKAVQIDTLNNNSYGRPIAPFFIQVKSLIEYAIYSFDSANMDLRFNEFNDSIQIKFVFKNKLIEFMWLEPLVKNSEGTNSRYELVIDNQYLPHKFVRRMPHQTSRETCTDIKISKHLDFEFSSIQQIPPDFKIKGRERGQAKSYELDGTKAPDWKLKEIYGDSISLSEIKQKVILIQFTGIGCGPCHASIPFLNKLANDYKNKNLELVCIETWSDNIAGIERYKDKNEMTYRFLVSKHEINDKYKIQGVPSFFILNEKRIIKKVIVGYQKGDTDKKIIEAINELL
jgi:thiol-disulfide isomerase/thioredoxin